ncbi:DUF6624 domain-containing protein [Streptomyces sp. GESEQ-4]|uniref:DUF6624 domain-containing protein n=1 Tax=Streptomyces sp. GESEQ-4 TaxID=2812655 RepID=UPI0027DE4BAE|nr:DUF6624 domain-containing protein [Streptomyces sp. GESEQ-4]
MTSALGRQSQVEAADESRLADASVRSDDGAAGTETADPLAPVSEAALAAELLHRADHERDLMRRAQADPTPQRRSEIIACRRANADALKGVVHRHGWPSADRVGATASTAALMILLHAPDLDFQLSCRDLIAQATLDGRCPAVHLAYIADHCAVEQRLPQFYGTRVNPATLRPYLIRRPESVDERRRDVGLGPLEEQMEALRHGC